MKKTTKIISKLRQIVEETDTLGGRIFDFSSQGIIIFSLIIIILETIPELSFYE